MKKSNDNASLWSPLVNGLDPYVPGEQPATEGLIKLNTNESPYPPSPQALAAIADAAGDKLRLYPDPESSRLKATIADYFAVESENVFVGNGSDEVLAHAFNAFFRQDKPILFPDLTYSFYPVYCQLYNIDYQLTPLNADFEIDITDYKVPNGGIIFPNPNAPTAIGLVRQSIIDLLEANPDSVVIVDEAYIDYAQRSNAEITADSVASVVDLVQQYNNLLVVHTLSKSRAFAGMRIGYAIGHPHLIDGLQRVKNSFNSYPVDRLAEIAAIASFQDESYFQSTKDKVIANRQLLVDGLEALNFDCLPSSANFVLVRQNNLDAKQLAEQLREHKIIVRYFATPRIAEFIRITVGTEEQNQQLLAVVSDLLSNNVKI